MEPVDPTVPAAPKRAVPDDDDDAAWVEPRPEPAEEPDHLTDEPGTP